jgi:hypothetical protein
MNLTVCPCDGHTPAVPTNPPQQSHINFRFGAYAEFRRAVLAPVAGEQSLSAWRTQGQGDLAVMMAEWFAYLGDILTFYDERIANQAYLRTADLDASVKRLIRILGYRPRPAIGATGVLAALVTPGQSAVLPRGLQIQSKPAPGQAPQTFELSADTAIGPPDQVLATTPPGLLSQIADFRFLYLSIGLDYAAPAKPTRRHDYSNYTQFPNPIGFSGPSASSGLLLQGAVTLIEPGTKLLLRPRDPALGDPLLVIVTQATVQPSPAGGQQTALALDIAATPPSPYAAAQATLERNNQSMALWSLYPGGGAADTVHLSSLARQIRPGAWVLFTGPSFAPLLTQVISTNDMIWDANSPPVKDHPLPIPHTVLVLSAGPPGGWPSNTGSITVLFDWISVGQLLDHPPRPWSGTPSALVAASAARFPTTNGAQVLLRDQSGVGAITTASSAGDFNVQLGSLPAPLTLQPPFEIMFNPLPITRGTTVSKEVLGSGDATQPVQSFSLARSPVTYLEHGATWASTIALTVNGEPWTEVPSFYGRAPNAQVFVTREDVDGRTHVDFGDGVNGARLPAGVNNVVATYRIGAGAASPPAGKLTVIAQSFPGLRSILNPVAVGGGADPDSLTQIRRYAPRSVLTFGRAVSVFDYEALAAQAPGVSRARAVWAWNDVRQRALVTVYVGDDVAAATSARAVLAAAGDPNRPVAVVQATPMIVTLALTLIINSGWDSNSIKTGVTAALADPGAGLFSADTLPIGQPVFDSQIEQAVLGVAGTIAIAAAIFTVNGANDPGPLHDPGEGGYYALDASDIYIVTSEDSHGG